MTKKKQGTKIHTSQNRSQEKNFRAEGVANGARPPPGPEGTSVCPTPPSDCPASAAGAAGDGAEVEDPMKSLSSAAQGPVLGTLNNCTLAGNMSVHEVPPPAPTGPLWPDWPRAGRSLDGRWKPGPKSAPRTHPPQGVWRGALSFIPRVQTLPVGRPSEGELLVKFMSFGAKSMPSPSP